MDPTSGDPLGRSRLPIRRCQHALVNTALQIIDNLFATTITLELSDEVSVSGYRIAVYSVRTKYRPCVRYEPPVYHLVSRGTSNPDVRDVRTSVVDVRSISLFIYNYYISKIHRI